MVLGCTCTCFLFHTLRACLPRVTEGTNEWTNEGADKAPAYLAGWSVCTKLGGACLT